MSDGRFSSRMRSCKSDAANPILGPRHACRYAPARSVTVSGALVKQPAGSSRAAFVRDEGYTMDVASSTRQPLQDLLHVLENGRSAGTPPRFDFCWHQTNSTTLLLAWTANHFRDDTYFCKTGSPSFSRYQIAMFDWPASIRCHAVVMKAQ